MLRTRATSPLHHVLETEFPLRDTLWEGSQDPHLFKYLTFGSTIVKVKDLSSCFEEKTTWHIIQRNAQKNGSTTSILTELHPTYHTTGEAPPGNDHISPIPAGTIESMIFFFPFGGIYCIYIYNTYDCSLESTPFIDNNTSFFVFSMRTPEFFPSRLQGLMIHLKGPASLCDPWNVQETHPATNV